MTQRLLHRAVARATGESTATVRRMGFSLVDPTENLDDLESHASAPDRRLGPPRRPPAGLPAPARPLSAKVGMNHSPRLHKENQDWSLLPAALRHNCVPCCAAPNNQQAPGPAIGFIAGREGLIVKADCGDAIVDTASPVYAHRRPSGCRLIC